MSSSDQQQMINDREAWGFLQSCKVPNAATIESSAQRPGVEAADINCEVTDTSDKEEARVAPSLRVLKLGGLFSPVRLIGLDLGKLRPSLPWDACNPDVPLVRPVSCSPPVSPPVPLGSLPPGPLPLPTTRHAPVLPCRTHR